MRSPDPRRRCGDSIYDYARPSAAEGSPYLRSSVHSEWNRDTDLSGKHVLLSDHFFYFGDRPAALPEQLLGIVKKGPGHKAHFPPQVVDDVVSWLHSLGFQPASIIGKPQLFVEADTSSSVFAPRDRQEDEADLAEPDLPPHRC